MIYAKLTEELKSAPKTDNPEYTIFLRNLVMSYELNDLYEYFVPIIEDPDIDKDIRFLLIILVLSIFAGIISLKK